ncbi:MAG: hypothetical protein C0503_08725 [Gemmatimonas sp.]|nr:hypothetical protein [Gemmatimonas sp.]
MPLKHSRALALGKLVAALVIALLATASVATRLQAQEPDFTVLSAYVEDANGGQALQPNTTLNLVLIANNKGEGAARNARLRVELRSATVAFVGEASARTREIVLGDFGGRVSEQVVVPIVATDRTASIDVVVTPLFDGQRGAPVPQTHRFPTGFPGATVATQAPSIPSRPNAGTTPTPVPTISGGGGRSWPAPGTRLSRTQILALAPSPDRTIGPNQSVTGSLGRGNILLDDGTPVDVWFYAGTQGESITVTQSSANFDSFLLFGRANAARVIATDDDGGGGLNSRIRSRLPANDTYVIIVNVLGEGSSGSYSLRLDTDRRVSAQEPGTSISSDVVRRDAMRVLGGAAAAAGAGGTPNERTMPQPSSGPMSAAQVFALPVDESRIVRMGATVQGSLAASDLKLSDNTFLDVYYFNGFQGDRVSVTLRSRAFDAYLHFGELGAAAAIATDDDSGSGTDARVTVTLPRTGTYVIIANALSAGGAGAYTLEVRSP